MTNPPEPTNYTPSLLSQSSRVATSSTSDQLQYSASMLSYHATLDLYRANAKKTQDPQTQLDFAKYLLEAAEVADEVENKENDAQGRNRDTNGKKNTKESLQAEGMKWMKRLATQSIGIGKPPFPEAQFFLAECYGKGTMGLSIDHDKAFSLYIQASKQNHPSATYRAAVCYELGAGTKRDNSRASGFYRKAAALGDPLAMHRLGLIFIRGLLNQPKNPREGVTWLKRAAAMANEEHPEALHDLALCYEPDGCPSAVIADESYACELYNKAADLDYAPSQYRLGCCFEYGLLNCVKDPAQSIRWYMQAAKKGNPEAELALSGWYLTGAEGILEQSDTEAYLWARKSADRGFAKAEYAVGYYSEIGVGVKQDLTEAARWYQRAASQGNRRAEDRLNDVKKMMNQGDLRTLKRSGKKDQDCVIS